MYTDAYPSVNLKDFSFTGFSFDLFKDLWYQVTRENRKKHFPSFVHITGLFKGAVVEAFVEKGKHC